jgi:hypothetical protein
MVKDQKDEKKLIDEEEKSGVPQKSKSKEDEIIDLLKENLKVSQEILWFNKKTAHWIFWQKVKGWFYVLIIVVPIILAAFYLPPILKDLYGEYQELWRMIFSGGGGIQSINDLNLNSEQVKDLKNSGLLK